MANDNQFDAVKRYHISKGWGDIAYHYFIEPNGIIKKGRQNNVVGTHTIGKNNESLGICLAGHFDKELPTETQTKALKQLLNQLANEYNIPKDKILPHRAFAVKTCYGSKLSDSWASDMIDKYDEEFIKKWNGKFILDVDDLGKVYYVHEGARHYVSPTENLEGFAKKFATGFKHKDVLKIPEGGGE